MWARVVEAMLGCWLAVSPFVFRHSADEPLLWWNDFSCAAITMLFALASYHRPFRHAHLLNLVTAIWLIVFGYVRSEPFAAAAYQNHIFVGLLLLMFAVIPNHASEPPQEWQQYTHMQASE
jgi:hypothetical protein